jgi:NADH dehydrogenase (ubiquinone) 1 alpha/beta subcomplex 1
MIFSKTIPNLRQFCHRVIPRFYSTTYETRQGIENRVFKVLHAFNKIKPETVTLKARFNDDMGLDSLDTVEVLMAIEEEFALEIPDIEADRIMTPGDAVAYIHKRMTELGTVSE